MQSMNSIVPKSTVMTQRVCNDGVDFYNTSVERVQSSQQKTPLLSAHLQRDNTTGNIAEKWLRVSLYGVYRTVVTHKTERVLERTSRRNGIATFAPLNRVVKSSINLVET
jgi:hypothetical protein